MKRNRSFETHSGWGAAVALSAYVAGSSTPTALAIGVAAGIAVELIQKAVPALGTYDNKDIVYTAIGAALGTAWILLLTRGTALWKYLGNGGAS